MVKKDVRPFCVPDGIDIEEMIASSLRQRSKKKEKINGFWFYLTLRKHQLKDDDEIDMSRAAILSKINLEWRDMTGKERERLKSIAKGEPQCPGLRLPNPVLQILMEDPLAEEKAENEAKIEEVRNHFWEVASVADVLLTIDNYDQIIQMKEEFMGLRQKLDKLIRLL